MESKERPILFSGPMVRAILDGKKTQTRRVVKIKNSDYFNTHTITPGQCSKNDINCTLFYGFHSEEEDYPCPYGAPGDRLWVRETWAMGYKIDVESEKPYLAKHVPEIIYRADEPKCVEPIPWKPSIHMFRKYSRINLEITAVRVERVQDISEDDAIAEGVQDIELCLPQAPIICFAKVWDSINGKKHPWRDNPWVWVVEFKKL